MNRKITTLILKLKHKVKILLGHTYKGRRKRPIVFILSTGRCGSTSIKEMFNQHPRFLAFHEDIEPLIQLSTELAEYPERQNYIFHTLDELFKTKIWEAKPDQIIVHSDHRLWNLVPYLSNYFPNAYFIHLIRNPFDSVKSFLQRDWYVNNDIQKRQSLFDKYRLYGDKVKDVSKEEWNAFDQIDKCLWYWNYVNLEINSQLEKLHDSRHSYITLEEFEKTFNKVIKPRFNINPLFNFQSVVKNISKKELDDAAVEQLIMSKIKKKASTLFLNYYPHLKVIETIH